MVRIIIDIQEVKEEKLTAEEIQVKKEQFEKEINREAYIWNPQYHHQISSQMNALLCGRKDWFMFGRILY